MWKILVLILLVFIVGCSSNNVLIGCWETEEFNTKYIFTKNTYQVTSDMADYSGIYKLKTLDGHEAALLKVDVMDFKGDRSKFGDLVTFPDVGEDIGLPYKILDSGKKMDIYGGETILERCN